MKSLLEGFELDGELFRSRWFILLACPVSLADNCN